MNRTPHIFLTFIFLSAMHISVYAGNTAEFKLFDKGKSTYDIVLSPAASPSEKTAAKELQSYIKDISGTTLPLINNGKGSLKHHIFIGFQDHLALKSGVKQPDFKDEGFIYRCIGKDLWIYGGPQRGTLYGVYSFLQKELGCRWFTPSYSFIPKLQKWAFKSSLYHQEKPAIGIRHNQYYEAADPKWAVRHFNNAIYQTPEYGGSERYWNAHTMGQFMPAKNYYADHPEYFALRNGKRIDNGQLCLSNPHVLRICIEKLRNAMRQNPDFTIYSLSQNDNQLYCQCEKCQALADHYGGQSGLLLWFVNQAADAVANEFPDKYVGTFAYTYTRQPPIGIKPRQNVVVRLCSIECCFVHSLEDCSEDNNKHFLADLKTWSTLAPHLYIWDYIVTYSQYLGPLPNFSVIGPNSKTFIRHNAIGIQEEAQYQTPCSEFSELRSYVTAAMLWNPDQDLDSLVNDFIYGYYGKSAKTIREYYDLVQGLVTPNIHMNIYPNAWHPIFSDEFLQKGFALMKRARQEAENEDVLFRVERVGLGLLFLKTMRQRKEALADGTFDELCRIVRRDKGRISETRSLEKFEDEIRNIK